MLARLTSAGLFGMEAFMVQVEADLSQGLPSFDLVGLPDAAVKESRDRVRAAMKNCGFDFPVSHITINLAPADVRKEGPIYDLPVLLALLKASGQLDADLSGSAFVGELSLGGEIRPMSGVLAMVIQAQREGYRRFFVPERNAAEGCVVEGIEVIPVARLGDLLEHLRGGEQIMPAKPADYADAPAPDCPDFADVKGQHAAKRALEIAAAGGHNVILIGPPGSGKSMLAKRLPSILPDMTFEEQIETTKIHSIAGVLPDGVPLVRTRPFRAPHHTISPAGLSGGGVIPRPGELSLAHNGVLFLDELPEFSRQAMEVLRQPLEDGRVHITRVSGSLAYDCRVMLVAAMNPCPCGYFGHPTRACTCSRAAVTRYLGRVSGPMLDRLDLHIEVPPVDYASLSASGRSECSADIRRRVNAARARQQERYRGTDVPCNAQLTPSMLQEACALTDSAGEVLKKAFSVMELSARAYDRILKVARTIADLAGEERVDAPHVMQAVQYRSLDRKYWRQDI